MNDYSDWEPAPNHYNRKVKMSEEKKKQELTQLQKQMIQNVINDRIGSVVFMLSHCLDFNSETLDELCEKYGVLRQDFFQAMRILRDPENWEFDYEEWVA